MLVKVLKAFPYHPDCRTRRELVEGDVIDIADDLVAGLQAEGLIGEASDEEIDASATGPVVIPPPVDIPADWRELDGLKTIALARQLGAAGKVTKASATAIIEAEVAQRAAG